MKELEGDGTTAEAMDLDSMTMALKGNMVNLFIYDESGIASADIAKLYDQYKKAYRFQIINGDDALDKLSEEAEENWINHQIQSNIDKGIVASLIDTSGLIRYHYKDGSDLKQMVEHIAVVIPRRPEKDIVQKKN